MRLTLKLIDSTQEIQVKILQALLKDLQKIFQKADKKLRNKLKSIVIESITSSPEYLSLSSGVLRSELGVPDIGNRIQRIFDIWFSNINTTVNTPKISGSSIKGSISINLIKTDLSDILTSDIATIVDSNSGSSVYWLEWLSLAGDKTILKDYEVMFGSNPRSRTGNAVMKVSANKKWKVPSEFSGTITDNWITRSIDRATKDIESIILQGLKESI